MTDRFDPHLVQAEYLHQVGFRDDLVARLRESADYSGHTDTRLVADQWLWNILQAFYGDLTSLPRIAIILFLLNRVVVKYELGEPITPEEIGMRW